MILLMPMAGRGARFADNPEGLPKPLITVDGRPMVGWALDSMRNIPRSRCVFIGLEEHERRFNLTSILRDIAGPDIKVILLPDVTAGQLCTVLTAEKELDCDEDVLIAPSDTYIMSSLGRDIARRNPDCAGILCVADMPGDRWSFARTDDRGRVVEVSEKVRISSHASTGHYYFRSGRELLDVGRSVVERGMRTLGEFYVILAYQLMLEQGYRLEISQAEQMWDMGTPEALYRFVEYIHSSGFTP